MNEIHGFGPVQPLRPTGNVSRAQGPAPAAEVNTPAVQDEVSLNTGATLKAEAPVQAQAAPPTAAPAAPSGPVVDVNAFYTADGGVAFGPQSGTRSVEDFDGFFLATHEQGHTMLQSLTPQVEASGLGPIAMIDDPKPEVSGVEFPDLSLNGPSTAHEGFFGLSGRRLA